MVTILSILYLAINLIFTDDFDGVVITLFVCIYYMLFSRFTMLYSFYLDEKNRQFSPISGYQPLFVVNCVDASFYENSEIYS